MGGTVIETESEKLRWEGREKGREEGREGERRALIKRMLDKGKTPAEISEICGFDLSYIRRIEENVLETV